MTLVNLKPSDEFEFKPGQGKILLVACGALGREIVDLIERNRWTAFDLQCLPAKWHNTPEKIVPALREKIRVAKGRYASIFVLYGDCGTGDDLRKAADLLDKINSQLADLYAEVSGKDKNEILAMMKEEKWMDAAEATAMKFATSDDQPETTANTRIVPAGMYRNTPENYLKPIVRLQAVKQRPVPDKFDAERKRKILDLTGIDLRVK